LGHLKKQYLYGRRIASNFWHDRNKCQLKQLLIFLNLWISESGETSGRKTKAAFHLFFRDSDSQGDASAG
jgi:hypothetical protein